MEFMHYYRDVFPEASITPKLHILEDHMVNFLRNWRVGCGLLDERGSESIHKVYNPTKSVSFYANIHINEDAFSKSPMNTTDVHAQNTSDITGHN